MSGFSRIKSALRRFVPPVMLDVLRRSVPDAVRPGTIQYAGNYSSWAQARAHATGYDAPLILGKAIAAARKVKSGKSPYERDTVVFDRIEQFWPVLAGLLHAATRSGGRLSVLDFGGALGSSYYQNRRFLEHIPEFRWSIVEQEHFVEAGRREFETASLRFYSTVEDCVHQEKPNVWLLSGVVQYLEDPYAFLAGMAAQPIPYAVLDRLLFLSRGKTRLAVQTIPPQIYDASYPCWIFDEGEFERLLSATFGIQARFDSHAGSVVDLGDASARYAGLLLVKRESRR